MIDLGEHLLLIPVTGNRRLKKLRRSREWHDDDPVPIADNDVAWGDHLPTHRDRNAHATHSHFAGTLDGPATAKNRELLLLNRRTIPHRSVDYQAR